MKPCVIFDIDGTLADNGHRLHWIATKPRNWHAYNEDMHLDKPIEPICALLRCCATRWPIILMTGRDSRYAAVTRQWLDDNYLPYNHLFMRDYAVHGSKEDHLLKLEWLTQVRGMDWFPLFVVEDRSRVVEMWRKAGLVALQCAEGNY